MGYRSAMPFANKIRAAAAALLLAGACLPAHAETVQTTQYSSYTVSGRTPAEIYRAILKRGPSVDGGRAIAATTAQAVQSHTLQQGLTSCQVTQFRLSFRFNVELPRLVSSSGLTPQDRYLWQQFTGFLKAHELQHTRLWLRCGRELERRVMALRAPNCEEVQRRADATWQRMKPACDKQQSNFDKEQRSELMSQPFMQRVMRGE
jgi:predicted secreted Zn-dependent protease